MEKCPNCKKVIFPNIAHVCPPTPYPKGAKCAQCGAAMIGTLGSHVCSTKKVVIDGKSPITGIYKKGSQTLFPVERLEPEHVSLVKRLNGTADSSGNTLSCSEDMLKRLVTALCFVEKEGLLSTTLANGWTIKNFMGLTEGFQIQVINNLWNECTMPKTYDCKFADMVESDGQVTTGQDQLPSSLYPNASKGAIPFIKGPVVQPFKKFGIGFRVDGSLNGKSSVDSIPRIQKEGMTAQVLNAWFMESVRKMMVKGTMIALNTSAPRIYIRAQDLFNETAVCISRSLIGATAFPERDTKDTVALWAVDTSGLTGFDTEKHQIDQKAHPWRPGEKCVERVPPKNVIGYVLIDRLGIPENVGGWKFRIPKDAKWTYLNVPAQDKKKYVEDELSAWADGVEYSIPGLYDFAN